MCKHKGFLMKNNNISRSKKYIIKQKKLGYKRVSFFTDEKFWKFIKKRALKEKMTIDEFLKSSFNFS